MLAVVTGWRTSCSGIYAHGEGLEEHNTSVVLGLSVTSWKVLFHCCRDSGLKELAQAKAKGWRMAQVRRWLEGWLSRRDMVLLHFLHVSVRNVEMGKTVPFE